MTAPAKRRWSYSLRTLFVVVTLLASAAGWYVYCYRWIQERRAVGEEFQQRMVNRYLASSGPRMVGTLELEFVKMIPPRSKALPWSLWVLGEEPTYGFDVCIDESEDDANFKIEIEQIRRLFPEARVADMSDLRYYSPPRAAQ